MSEAVVAGPIEGPGTEAAGGDGDAGPRGMRRDQV
jgi:hypothetical protein